MARARGIKPSFFTNEDLAEINPLGRLLFIGLWCLADRAGRLEDRPKRIKIELLPCDDCDVDALLQALHDRGLIQRYAAGEHRLIQVVNFAKHQSPHHQERESRLPAPEMCEANGERTRGRPKASLGFIPDKYEASPGAIALTADSLTADSPTPKEGDAVASLVVSDADARLACPHERIIGAWHETLPELPAVKQWGSARARSLQTRWREQCKAKGWASQDEGVAWFRRLFEHIRRSAFLMGQSGRGDGHEAWTCTLPWLIKAEYFARVLEGHYHREAA